MTSWNWVVSSGLSCQQVQRFSAWRFCRWLWKIRWQASVKVQRGASEQLRIDLAMSVAHGLNLNQLFNWVIKAKLLSAYMWMGFWFLMAIWVSMHSLCTGNAWCVASRRRKSVWHLRWYSIEKSGGIIHCRVNGGFSYQSVLLSQKQLLAYFGVYDLGNNWNK